MHNGTGVDSPTWVLLAGIDRRVRSFNVPSVTAENVKQLIAKNVYAAFVLMTDESPAYGKIGAEFAGHHTVNRGARLGGYIGIKASENFFSIAMRGITGTYHSVSEAHLHRYLADFDLRYNNRSGLGSTTFLEPEMPWPA